MNKVILSARYPQFTNALKRRGYHVIESEILENLIPYERDHADMQCLILHDTAFVLRECPRLAAALKPYYRVILTRSDIGGEYPDNIRLNAAVLGKNIIANTKYLDESVKEYAKQHGYQMIHVNQGYAKCSCAVVSDNALITADNGIYHSLKETNIEVLKIRQGRVELKGADCGFIGGASGQDISKNERILYFAGDICTHPDHAQISAFCEKHGTKAVSLTNGDLIDIGGMLFC